MSLNDIADDDMLNVFLNTDGFGETISYVKESGTARSIVAIVDRDPPMAVGSSVKPKMRIIVHNNATTGILSSELDSKDRVIVEYRKGASDDPVDGYGIKRDLDHAEDAGMLALILS